MRALFLLFPTLAHANEHSAAGAFGLSILLAIGGIVWGLATVLFRSFKGKKPVPDDAAPERSTRLSTDSVTSRSSAQTESGSAQAEYGHAATPHAVQSAKTISDDWAYEIVASELEQNDQDKGQWARAFAEAGGDENKTKALYIQRRVQRIVTNEQERIRELNTQRLLDLEAAQEQERQERKAAEEHRLRELIAARQDREMTDQAGQQNLQPTHQVPAHSPDRPTQKPILRRATIVLGATILALAVFILDSPPPDKYRQTDGQQAVVERDAYARGFVAYNRGDFAGALKVWKYLALQGNASAQNGLGHLYANGLGVAQDYKVAFEWYSRAAAQGLTEAQAALADMYAKGIGIPQDFRQAFEWNKMAAANANAHAQMMIGWHYEHGRGVAQDYRQALDWYSKAAAQDDTDAQNLLGWYYEHGLLGVTQDHKQAFDWYSRSASNGNAFAQANLSNLYALGLGVDKDFAYATELFGKATTQDLGRVANGYRSDAEKMGSAFNLAATGWLYEAGKAFGKDVVLAHMFFTLARNAGLAEIDADQNRLASLMTTKQLTESKLLAAGWKVGSPFPTESITGKQ